MALQDPLSSPKNNPVSSEITVAETGDQPVPPLVGNETVAERPEPPTSPLAGSQTELVHEHWHGNEDEPTTRAQLPVTMPSSGECFGNYQIEKELGRGGMGVVYKALDTRLNRVIALKLVSGEKLDEKLSQRFVQEARATAQLNHPHIVKLFEIGDKPLPYFTMEYIDGETLKEYLANNSLKFLEMAALVQKIAEALQSAHDHGIIHRDIKPSNIMMSGMEPKVMDFGLAKIVNVQLSTSKDLLGTPTYMPPEQTIGTGVDNRADVYALGATMYEMLTRRPPFQGESYFNILHQVVNNDPIPLRRLNPDIPKELEAICLKAMSKKRERRYAQIAHMAQDLRNFQENKPIAARPYTRFTQVQKFIARHRVAVTAALLVMGTILAGGIVSYIFWQQAEAQARLAEERRLGESKAKELAIATSNEVQRQKLEIQEQRNDALYKIAQIALTRARHSVVQDDWATSNYRARECGTMAAQALSVLNRLPERYRETKAAQAEATRLVRQSLVQHGLIWAKTMPQAVSAVAFAPDGQYYAAASGYNVYLYDAGSVTCLQTLELSDKNSRISHIEFSPDSKILACGVVSTDGTADRVMAWELFESGRHQERPLLKLSAPTASATPAAPTAMVQDNDEVSTVMPIAFSPDGSWLLAFGTHGPGMIKLQEKSKAYFVDLSKLRKGLPEQRSIFFHRFSPQGKYLVLLTTSQRVILWNCLNNKRLDFAKPNRTMRNKAEAVMEQRATPNEMSPHQESKSESLAFSPDGKLLASPTAMGVILWNLEDPNQITQQLSLPVTQGVQHVCFSPKGDYLAAVSFQKIVVWKIDPSSGGWETMLVKTLIADGTVQSAVFSPDGTMLLTAVASRSSMFELPAPQKFQIALWHVGSEPVRRRKATTAPTPPRWTKELLPDATVQPSSFDIYANIPGWFVEAALARKPKELTAHLLGLQVKDENLELESFTGETVWE